MQAFEQRARLADLVEHIEQVARRAHQAVEPGDDERVASLSTASAFLSCGRSDRAPDCFSANNLVEPAAFSSATWASSVCPSVETRQ
jgi:hypothetical protein